MHTTPVTPALNLPFTNCPPVQLWVGSETVLQQQTTLYLQQLWCAKACATCVTCTAIASKRFYSCLWLQPERQYTLELIEPIFQTIQFALDADQQFFFIVTRADMLTQSAANALLKSLEEPPAGYHFILHCYNAQTILPTIRSRCVLFNFAHTAADAVQHKALFDHFTTSPHDPFSFMQQLEACKITEQESAILIEQIIAYWIRSYQTALSTHNQAQQQKIADKVLFFQQTLHNTPMPGSAKLFWKDLFLQTL